MKARAMLAGVSAGDERARVVGEDADVGKLAPLDVADELGDAVLEHFGADHADRRMRRRLRRQVLAAAEAELEPNGADGPREERARIERPLCRKLEAELRQTRFDEALLALAQRAPAAPAVQQKPRPVFVPCAHRCWMRRGAARRQEGSAGK